MKHRAWILFGVFTAMCLAYIVLFTDWLRPAPIEIASQIRFSTQPLNFGHLPAPKKTVKPVSHPTNLPSIPTNLVEAFTMVSNAIVRTNHVARTNRVAHPASSAVAGLTYGSPGGVANVTFSLDGYYELTRLRVEDVPADGSAPKVLWLLTGKSIPTSAFLYGHEPQGMKPVVTGTTAQPLCAGVPYRLVLEAGRRRGTNFFSTELIPE